MSMVEGIVGMIASVCAIIGALVFTMHYMAKRFDRWIDAVVENSNAVKDLTVRVVRLEGTIEKNVGN